MKFSALLRAGAMLALLAMVTSSLPARAADPAADATSARNMKIKAANALIADLNVAMRTHDWPTAESDVQKLIALGPLSSDPWSLYATLGNVESQLGKYQESIDAYETGIGLARDAIKPDVPADKLNATIASMLTGEGNAYLKLRKNPEAIAAYRKAAALAKDGGIAYFNLCATMYNTGLMTDAIAACDESLRIDPTRADAYFIKGSALFGNGKMTGSVYVAPPGTVEALQKYLELAPAGTHAGDVKEMLKAIGVTPK
jgi:tetratricopeptide (TPR) repeat protein